MINSCAPCSLETPEVSLGLMGAQDVIISGLKIYQDPKCEHEFEGGKVPSPDTIFYGVPVASSSMVQVSVNSETSTFRVPAIPVQPNRAILEFPEPTRAGTAYPLSISPRHNDTRFVGIRFGYSISVAGPGSVAPITGQYGGQNPVSDIPTITFPTVGDYTLTILVRLNDHDAPLSMTQSVHVTDLNVVTSVAGPADGH